MTAKKVLIIHGTDCRPDDQTFYWYAWLRAELAAHGYTVATPSLPSLNHEPAAATIQALQQIYTDKPDIIVGHSAGVPLLLSLLEQGIKAERTYMVAGLWRQTGVHTNPVLQDTYDWPAISTNGGDFTYFNSVNDPWGCNDIQGREMFDRTGGTLIIRNDGHFGSQGKQVPYTTFPLLKAHILA